MNRIWAAVLLMVFGALAAVALCRSIAVRPAASGDVLYLNRPVRLWALDLNSPASAIRDKASAVVRDFGPEAIPELVRLLRTPDPVLARPLKAIGSRTPRKVTTVLFKVVDPYEASARRTAGVLALRTMGTNAQPALAALSRALRDDQTVSWYASLALAELGPPGRKALIDALPTAAPTQAGYICYALSTQGANASNAIPALRAVLDRGSADLARKAANSLSSIGPPAIPALIEALTHANIEVRLAAIHALAMEGVLARSAVPKLIDVAKGDEPAVRLAAVDALVEIRPNSPDVVDLLVAALENGNPAVRLKAITGLGRSTAISRKPAPLLRALLSDESPEVRAEAATLVGQLELTAETAGPALRQALQDTNEVVRIRAQQALDKIRQRSS